MELTRNDARLQTERLAVSGRVSVFPALLESARLASPSDDSYCWRKCAELAVPNVNFPSAYAAGLLVQTACLLDNTRGTLPEMQAVSSRSGIAMNPSNPQRDSAYRTHIAGTNEIAREFAVVAYHPLRPPHDVRSPTEPDDPARESDCCRNAARCGYSSLAVRTGSRKPCGWEAGVLTARTPNPAFAMARRIWS